MSEPLGGLGDVVDLLAAVVVDDVLGREVVVDVDPELALAGVLRQVADVAVGGEDAVVVAQVALDRPRLRRRLDDHEVLGHGRECSTGSFAHPYLRRVGRWRGGLAPGAGGRVPQTSRMRRRKSSSISSSSSSSVSARRPASGGTPAATGTARASADLVPATLRAGSRRTGCGGTGRRRPTPCRRRRSAACRRACAGSCSAGRRRRRRQLEQVGQQGLLVVEVEDGVADHGGIVRRPRSPGMARWSRSRGGRSRRPGGRAPPDTHTPMPTRSYCAFIMFT